MSLIDAGPEGSPLSCLLIAMSVTNKGAHTFKSLMELVEHSLLPLHVDYVMLFKKSSMARLASPWATATGAGMTSVFALALHSTAASAGEDSLLSTAPCSFSHVMHALLATGGLTCDKSTLSESNLLVSRCSSAHLQGLFNRASMSPLAVL